jgi:hypothetical protein
VIACSINHRNSNCTVMLKDIHATNKCRIQVQYGLGKRMGESAGGEPGGIVISLSLQW